MRAVHILPALPLAAAAAGVVFLAATRFRRARWAALALYTLSVPALALLAYRFWDHHVGPDAFAVWQLALSPASLSFLLPLALVSPPLLWAMQARGAGNRRDAAASALACFGLAAAFTAVLGEHLFLMAAALGLATWSALGAAVLEGKRAARLLPFMSPLLLADLCLALGILFLYLEDPTRGLSFPATALRPTGMLAAACSLLLASSLLRLGCFPLQRWMGGAAGGSAGMRLIHLLAVDLTLGTFLLFSVTRTLFVWQSPWAWICLGVAAASLLETARELLHASGSEETWGLLCAAVGAGIALIASPGGQASAAASRLALWAGVPALALVALASRGSRWTGWCGVAGGASIMGLPPLAGFASLWMGLKALSGEFAAGETVVFLAAVPLLFAGALVAGTVAFLSPHDGGEEALEFAAPAAFVLAAGCIAVGLYPGAIIDLFMREYGLPLEIPFASWTTLGWAALICAGLAAVVASAWTRMKGSQDAVKACVERSLPLLPAGRAFALPWLSERGVRLALVCGEALLFAAWVAVMLYLGLS